MDTNFGVGTQRRLWRSRWAAIGAAVAVTLGGGGMVLVNAASSVPSSVVTIDPVRILDTRDPMNIGLSGPFVSAVSQKLQVTGVAVPAGATGVLLNVTVVGPSAAGYLSVRPGDASGAPSTSSLNFNAGDVVPNAVQVGLPTAGANAGKIDITYDAFGQAGPTTEVLIDVVGYMAGTSGPSRILLGTGTLNIPAGGFVFGTIYCPPGYVAVGTGFNTSGSQNFVKIYGSDRMGYFLSSTFSFATSVDAQVVCMSGLTNAALSVESSDEASWQSDLESMKLRFAEEMSLQSGE